MFGCFGRDIDRLVDYLSAIFQEKASVFLNRFDAPNVRIKSEGGLIREFQSSFHVLRRGKLLVCKELDFEHYEYHRPWWRNWQFGLEGADAGHQLQYKKADALLEGSADWPCA